MKNELQYINIPPYVFLQVMNFSLRCLVADFMKVKRKKRCYTTAMTQEFLQMEEDFIDFGKG